MIEISVKNMTAIVDEIDGDLTLYKWRPMKQSGSENTFYAIRTENKKTIYMHRIILERKLGRSLERSEEVDHIYFNTLDNRRERLRLATPTDNRCNKRGYKNSTSKFKGVSWDAKRNKWRSQICKNRVVKTIGSYTDEKEAARAYDKKALELFGEFAYTNFPREDYATN